MTNPYEYAEYEEYDQYDESLPVRRIGDTNILGKARVSEKIDSLTMSMHSVDKSTAIQMTLNDYLIDLFEQ